MPFGAVCDKFLLLADFQESGVTTVATKPCLSIVRPNTH